MSNASEESTEPGLGIGDDQLPDDLVPGEDNPLAEGLEPGEDAGDLLADGQPATESDSGSESGSDGAAEESEKAETS